MASLRVDLEQGSVLGALRDGVKEFLAVAYGSAERWRRPTAPQSTAQRAVRCPQPGAEGQEDCLQLNIWVAEAAEKAPVLVYIHGGGGKCHSAHGDRETGHELARRGGEAVESGF